MVADHGEPALDSAPPVPQQLYQLAPFSVTYRSEQLQTIIASGKEKRLDFDGEVCPDDGLASDFCTAKLSKSISSR